MVDCLGLYQVENVIVLKGLNQFLPKVIVWPYPIPLQE